MLNKMHHVIYSVFIFYDWSQYILYSHYRRGKGSKLTFNTDNGETYMT